MKGTKAVTAPLLKAGIEEGLAEGEALAMISLYGLKDHDKDRVRAGAFDEFAASFDPERTPLPMVFQHGRGLYDYVGEARELIPDATDEKGRAGLAVKVAFDVDSDIPEARSAARQAYKLVKGRRVSQWSYAWEGDSEQLKDGTRELSNMRLSEVSPVLAGALSETATLAVKQEEGEGTPEEEAQDQAAFQKTWAGIGEMIATDADLVEWLADANGPDVAGIVGCIAGYIAQDTWTEAQEGDDDSLDTPYFKARRKLRQAKARQAGQVLDPHAAAARLELELEALT